MWRDFGGHREACDDDSAATAARECAEETLGVLCPGPMTVDVRAVAAACAALAPRLRDASTTLRVRSVLRRGAYIMYVTRVPHVATLMLRLARQQNDVTAAVQGAEKTAFAWCGHGWVLRVGGGWRCDG